MPETDLSLLIQAAKTAGQIATRYWQGDLDIREKDAGAGPVTQADLEIDRELGAMLRAARPNYGWLSEESTDTPDRLERDTCFIIDPLDGTRSFIAGETTWAHSLAVVHKGRVDTAVVYLPKLELMYTAQRGQGAFVNDMPLKTSAAEQLTGAKVIAARPAMADHVWKGGKCPNFTRHYRPSLAYRLALVAQGRYDAMMTLRDSWEWDIAAGALLIELAGGTVTDRLGRPITFNSTSAKSQGIVAGAPAVHSQILAALA